MTRSCRALALPVLAAALLVPGLVRAQSADTTATTALATRAELEAAAARLTRNPEDTLGVGSLTEIKRRLAQGDFRPGDRILLTVENEPTLSDTFAVAPDTALHLPSPTVGALPLAGVLRSELDAKVQAYLKRFLVRVVARVEPLVSLSIQGGVAKAGFYSVPAAAQVSDALMAAGGTTHEADMDKLKIEREGEAILEGKEVRRALAAGLTLDRIDLRNGDEIVVPERRKGGFTSGLNFLWAIVSIAGGVFGLSRAF